MQIKSYGDRSCPLAERTLTMYDMLGKLIQRIVTGPAAHWGALCDLLEKLNTKGEEWYPQLTKFLRKEPCWVTASEAVVEKAEQVKVYLRRLFPNDTIIVGAVDGTKTIVRAKEVFTRGVYVNFTRWDLDVSGAPTPDMPVEVYEMVQDGTSFQLFGSLNTDLGKLCFTQGQIVEFCEKHREHLRTKSYGTFFLFREEEQFFVASVRVEGGGRLRVIVYSLENDNVWESLYSPRVVVPQQTS